MKNWKEITPGVAVLVCASILIFLASCNNPPAANHSAVPSIQSATTQNADAINKAAEQEATAKKQAGELDKAVAAASAAGDSVGKAKVQGQQASILAKPVPAAVFKLSEQQTTLTDAGTQLKEVQGELAASKSDNEKLIDTGAALSADLTATKLDLAGALDAAQQSESALVDMTKRATTAETFIKDHYNDLLGAKVHRFFHGVGIVTLIVLLVLIFGGAILGMIYGLPAITTPAASIVGDAINYGRLAWHKVSTFVLAAVPVVGHYIVTGITKLLTELHILKQSATVVSVAVPTPAPAGAKPPSPELLAALARRGIA